MIGATTSLISKKGTKCIKKLLTCSSSKTASRTTSGQTLQHSPAETISLTSVLVATQAMQGTTAVLLMNEFKNMLSSLAQQVRTSFSLTPCGERLAKDLSLSRPCSSMMAAMAEATETISCQGNSLTQGCPVVVIPRRVMCAVSCMEVMSRISQRQRTSMSSECRRMSVQVQKRSSSRSLLSLLFKVLGWK